MPLVVQGTVVDTADDMKRTRPALIIASVLVASSVRSTGASDRLSMNVTPRQALAPVNLRVRVRIEPHADNRTLVVVADSAEFYRSSEIPLEGDRAPRTIVLQFPNLPGGEYDVTSTLLNSQRRERAAVSQTARVISVTAEP